MPLNRKIAYYLFFLGFFGLAGSIAVSKFTTSLSMFLMAIAWFVQWNWKEKWTRFKSQQWVLMTSVSLFLIFVIGLVHSENMSYAMKDLKIKAPLFIIPVVFALGEKFDYKKVIGALVLMVSSAIAASVIGLVKYKLKLGTDQEITDLRALSPFISLIRLSLILSFGFGMGLWGLIKLKSKLKWLLLIPVFWIVFFFGYSQSLTGIVLVPIISIFFLFFAFQKQKKIAAFFAVVFISVGIYGGYEFNKVYQMVFDLKPIKELYETPNANKYKHFQDHLDRENGYHVQSNICYRELKQEWEKRSDLAILANFEEFKIKAVLMRYLTSRGLTKDSLGISNLSDDEIKAIENGVTNVYYINRNPILVRLHQSLMEIQYAIMKGQYYRSSVAGRLMFAKTGISIISDHLFFGVGTGDVKDVFLEKYSQLSGEESKFDKKSHNQFITTGVALGLIGLIIFIGIIIFQMFKYDGSLKYLFWLGQLVLLLSMFWEDTLETQAGVAIFTVVTSVFLFSSGQAIKKGKEPID